MADVAEAEPSLGAPAASETPAVVPRSMSHLAGQNPSQGGAPKATQRSFSMNFGGSPKAAEEGTARAGPASGFSQWARGFRLPTSLGTSSSGPSSETPKVSPFSMLTSGFGKRVPAKASADPTGESLSTDDSVEAPSAAAGVQEGNAFDNFTKGFLDSSRNAVRTVQLKARHLVSQNKRRYQVLVSFFSKSCGPSFYNMSNYLE